MIKVLQGFAARNGVQLRIMEGVPLDPLVCQAAIGQASFLVIWDAERPESLASYVARHVSELATALIERSAMAQPAYQPACLVAGGAPPPMAKSPSTSTLTKLIHTRMLVLCNKSDVQPCPLPEIAALDTCTVFLAGSALKGTNMDPLWRFVETCAAPRPKGHSPVSSPAFKLRFSRRRWSPHENGEA